MHPVKTFLVRPALPERLRGLEELAYNLRWAWDHDTLDLFRRLDFALWRESGHNPVLMLGSISEGRLHELAQDDSFLAQLDAVLVALRDYVANPGTWYLQQYGSHQDPLVAYFSMEFGVTESLPIYSGGLGILAGDHLKSASDLGVPLIGVGLLYQKGYFRQYLTSDGWQQERRSSNDFSVMPLRPCYGADGRPLRVAVEVADRTVFLRLWHVQIGRVTLLLLDANIPENASELQDITGELYGGDGEMRIRQEIVLGVGGVRALRAAGIRPRVFHMNEGHCAFLAFERIRELIEEHGLSFPEALETVTASGIFTTHTPVPAGIDVFPPDQFERYFAPLRGVFGMSGQAILDLGRLHPGRADESFNMAVLAIRTASVVNGVSRLHARVSRAMFRELWPSIPIDEIPIGHVTNGIHPRSWISHEIGALYDRYLGPGWAERPASTRLWRGGDQIPAEELWRIHERRRGRLVRFARQRFVQQLRSRGAGAQELAEAEHALDPKALTIGFGRRFATYKRATLLLRDPARLQRILNAPGRPVQVVFAGKAHPRDEPGKELIQQIVRLARQPEFQHRLVFLEDHDQIAARYMVQGVDVWLNTPTRPLEASGTSGMKAAFNGGINLSVLDGWWDEAYSPTTGWAIGRGEEYQDDEYRDRVESSALLDLLETEIVPLFYRRDSDNTPGGWTELMRTAMIALCPVFNTNRMLQEYVVNGYAIADQRRTLLEHNGFQRARELAIWKDKIRKGWPCVDVARVEVSLPERTHVGEHLDVTAWIRPGGLALDDLAPQVFLGRLHEARDIVGPEITQMETRGLTDDNCALFHSSIACQASGTHGLTVRILPRHPDLGHPHEMGLITWAR